MSTHVHSAACGCKGHSHEERQESRQEHLRHVLDHAAHYLPTQGPMGVFVHHNTLHAFQHLPFEQAVVEAAHMFHTEPYMLEEAYQAERARGRIRVEDVDFVLSREEDAEIIPGRLSRRGLRRVLLIPGVRRVNGRNITWQIEEGDWLESFRQDLPPAAANALKDDRPAALWDVCARRMPAAPAPAPQRVRRPHEAVMARLGLSLDQVVHPPLIRLTGAYLDQGIAYWPMPLREEGLLRATRKIMTQRNSLFPAHLAGIGDVFRDQQLRDMGPEEVILECLDKLGVPEEEWDTYITAELVALGGWAGMVRMLEMDVTLAPHDRVRCSLMEFLALRLSYTVVALEDLMGNAKAWRQVNAPASTRDPLTPVARLFDAAQLTGLNSKELGALPEEMFVTLCHELEACHEYERRRLLHAAYERRHERQILVPLARHRALPPLKPMSDRLAAQVMFCIDEREESIRRALEEVDPDVETIGAAGFFGVAIDYAGIDDARGVSLCPVVVKPAHEVREVVVDEHSHLHKRRRFMRRVWARVVRNSYISSRTLVRGWFSTACLGFLSLFPLALRVLSPLAYSRLVAWLNKAFLPEPRTELAFMSEDAESRSATSGLMQGFSTQEMVDRVAGVLGSAGLHRAHARLVVILGHGSTSLNNPYESAYCCGACGGRTGAPNARLFALMANRPAVREGLRAKGIIVPEDTWFLGGYHDTCSDNIEYFDVDLMPDSHLGELNRVQNSLDKARALSAQERTRRFETAPPDLNPARSLRHVQERSEHIGEPRPEYGHCTNAVAIVGRREMTRGLFLDRRAFLVSYDATKDPADEALARVLGAVIPVCGGISLEYYFSTVDNEGYGSGTKLPHNISGLVGVMNGFQGDLRTGLPLQTVEIHEPVRILFVVETTPERLMKTILANKELKEFVVNRWIRIATMDPEDGHIEIYRDGTFEKLEGDDEPLVVVSSSHAHFRGHREHLPLARIDPAQAQAA